MPRTDAGRHNVTVGTVLRDFTVQAVIGPGGIGIDYRSGHNLLELTVAIKEYLPVELAVREGSTARPRSEKHGRGFVGSLRRFWKEAQALIDFDNPPNIVSCQDLFQVQGRAWLVKAYGDGQ